MSVKTKYFFKAKKVTKTKYKRRACITKVGYFSKKISSRNKKEKVMESDHSKRSYKN